MKQACKQLLTNGKIDQSQLLEFPAVTVRLVFREIPCGQFERGPVFNRRASQVWHILLQLLVE